MIVVLKDADFSANNIEKVNVDAINEFTLAAITASGNDTMTDNQISALNAFFKTIGAWSTEENTIFSRMNVIYLPIIAKDVAHSMINYVDNTIPKTSGGVDVTPGGTAVIRSHGLVATDFTTNSNSAKITRAWAGECSILWLRTEKFSSLSATNQNYSAWVREQPSNKVLCGVYETNIPGSSASTLSLAGISGLSYKATSYDADIIAAQGFSIREDNDAYLIYNGVATTETGVTFSNAITPVEGSWFETKGFGVNKINDAASIGVVMFGKALTNAEMDSVAAAINGLRDAFLV